MACLVAWSDRIDGWIRTMDDVDQKQLMEARGDVLAGGLARRVRSDVRASWDRAQRVGLHPDRHLPQVVMGDDEVRHRQVTGHLAAVWPVMMSVLGGAAAEPGHLLFVGDADGHLLWVRGDSAACRAAERAHLVAGAGWSEVAAGTNGVGTALALRKPFQVHGAEHYLSVAVDYTCTAAPIRDPATGALVGVVDVTCPRHRTRSLALPLVAAAARLAEASLAEHRRRCDSEIRARYLDRVLRRCGGRAALVTADGRVVHAEPADWITSSWSQELSEGATTLPDGRRIIVERLAPNGPFAVYSSQHDDTLARVTVLGRKFASITIDGVNRQLSLRHSEIVVLLLAHPDGLTAEELAREIYGATGKPGTIRAELTRLRALLGYRLVANPYRLIATTADFLDLEHIPTAERSIHSSSDPEGPLLLPNSRARGIMRLRNRLLRPATTL